MATVPAQIKEEQATAERRRAQVPEAKAASTKERARLSKLDGELPFIVSFVGRLERDWNGPAPAARVVDYRPAARIRARDVIARALEVGLIADTPAGFRVTAAGHRYRG